MTLWRIWTRTSYAPFFLAIAAVIELLLRLGDPSPRFRFEWPWATVLAGEWLVFGGAVIAGTVAWEAWLTRRRLDAFLTGPSRGSANVFAVWAGAATWWTMLHTLFLAVHLMAASLSDAVGPVQPLIIAVQYIAVWGFCALGALVGWYLRWVFAAPLLTLALVAVVLSGAEAQRIMWFTSASSLLGWQPVTSSYALQAAVYAGVLVVVLGQLLPTVLRRGLLVAGLVLSLVTVPAAASGRSYWKPAVSAAHCARQADGLTVCAGDGFESLYPRVAASLTPVVRRMRAWGVEPPVTYVIAAGDSVRIPDRRDGVISVAAVNGRTHVPPAALVMAATIQTGCARPTSEQVERQAILYGWFLREFGTDAPGRYPPQPVQQLRSLDTATQRAWVQEAYARAWACDRTTPTYPDGVTP
ncbi:hypothetical protein [Streptomyces sp. NPDC020996]|uniref:hypothetical protein n=1 Tax=Streptomyces sp. NPDC020996 TaxID=3154791 RepID=UPI0033C47B0F